MRIYTRRGDDGTTGLLFGGRVANNDPAPVAYGAVDEAQAFIGLARADCERGGELDAILVTLERDLWVLMSELATAPDKRDRLEAGKTIVTAEMVSGVESLIDSTMNGFDQPTEFVVPGQDRVAALLDVARTVVRRAERQSVDCAAADSHVLPYLNRLSDLLWSLARQREGTSLPSRLPRKDSAG